MTAPEDPQRMPRGTYPVELHCLCRRTGRYFNIRCPDVAAHGKHSEQDWYGATPVFQEPYMADAREYHETFMAEVEEKRAKAAGEAA